MPADTAPAWPDPERSGEDVGRRLYYMIHAAGWEVIWQGRDHVPDDAWPIDMINREVSALVEAARRDGLRKAWDAVNALPKPAWKTTDYVEIWGDVRADCLNEITAAIRARSTEEQA